MTGYDIARIAQSMGHVASFKLRATPSAQAKNDYAVYACLWLDGKRRHIGNITKLAQISEEELRTLITSKIDKEDNVDRSRH